MRSILFVVILFYGIAGFGQKSAPPPTIYRATLVREDNLPIVFMIESVQKKGKPVWLIRNADEKLEVADIRTSGDSVWIEMPFFESAFYLKKNPDQSLSGNWVRGTSTKTWVMPAKIEPIKNRFPLIKGNATGNVSGRWKIEFTRPNGNSRPAIGEFYQKGNIVTGTILTPSGDYRYLDGILSGDSLLLSTFDGSHAYFFSAKLSSAGKIERGLYASGPVNLETWTAVKDPKAVLDETSAAMYLKDGEEKLNFRFPDLDSNFVSINDPRFKDKVVVIQIMGSWCPNCMDETAFLSKYYNEHKQRGLEVVGLAYEYGTDFYRSQRTLKKFRDKFDVQYPMLITGVTTTDSLRTEKTLPQLTPIKVFPSTIFLDKTGKVRKVHTGFYGPGTGEHYVAFKKEFEEIIDGLLKE
ncbi:TlpA disulfide reductase family protein [Pollutibacter soli]|uniref:peroxiredoxin family protein n=1 Tax=Pollutibacter soli TaxID=3034157 RepID=UPI003013B671